VRRLTDAERLGNLAPVWYSDRRPEVRRLLFEYLDQPLNAFRHEALVKRLFKLAEQAGDDGGMARFLGAFAPSGRRGVKKRSGRVIAVGESQEAADALVDQLRARGLIAYRRTQDTVHSFWPEEVLVSPLGTALWRPYWPRRVKNAPFGTPVDQLRGKVPVGP